MNIERHMERLKESIEVIDEESRDPLCYGAPKPREFIKKIVAKFNELKDLFKKKGVEIE